MLFCFGASLDSEPYLIGDMLGRTREWRWIKIGECGLRGRRGGGGGAGGGGAGGGGMEAGGCECGKVSVI